MSAPDIVELQAWDDCRGVATYGLMTSYLTDKVATLTDQAEAALEWAVENRCGPVEFGGTNEAGLVYLVFRNQKDAVLFKTFWL